MSEDKADVQDCAWFETVLPDAAGWDERGDPSVPAGQAVANTIAEATASSVCR